MNRSLPIVLGLTTFLPALASASPSPSPSEIPSPSPNPVVMVISTKPVLDETDMKQIEAKFEVDPTPGFPALDNVDDPGTPEHGDIEANFLSQGATNPGGSYWVQLPYADLNYGTGFWIFKHLQLKAEGGYTWKATPERDGSIQNGMGNALFGVKWMFYSGADHEAQGALKDLNAGIYPQIQIAPVPGSVRSGIADGGKIYIFPFLVTKKFTVGNRPIGVSANVGYEYGTGGQPNAVYWSAGTGIAVTKHTAAEVSYSEQYDYGASPLTIRKYEFGLVTGLPHDSRAFVMVGHQEDGSSHLTWNVGIQKVFHTKRKSAVIPLN